MGAIINRLNEIFNDATLETIQQGFADQSYIRLNMIHISPITLKHFKFKLKTLGLIDWEVKHNGIEFKFEDFDIFFKGSMSVCLLQPKHTQNQDEDTEAFPKFYCVELDFEPVVTPSMNSILNEIENYLKSADSMFFMSYFINTDLEILNNDLSQSMDFLVRRLETNQKREEHTR